MEEEIVEEHIIKIRTTKNGAEVYVDDERQILMQRFEFDKTLKGIPAIVLNFLNQQLQNQHRKEQIIEEHTIKLQVMHNETKIYLDEKLVSIAKKFTLSEPILSNYFYFQDGKIIKPSELQPDNLCDFR